MYPGTLAQCEHPSRTLPLFPGDEKHHPMQSYQVKHTNHLYITYSQVKTLQTSLRPQVVGCCVQKSRSPSIYMYHPRETSCSKSLLTGNHDTSVKQMILNLSQYQEKVLEEEKLSLDAPGSKLQDTALNCQAPALELSVGLCPLRLACFQMYWPLHHSLQVKNPLILCLSKAQPKTSDHHRHGGFSLLIEVRKETVMRPLDVRGGKEMSSNLVGAEWE